MTLGCSELTRLPIKLPLSKRAMFSNRIGAGDSFVGDIADTDRAQGTEAAFASPPKTIPRRSPLGIKRRYRA